MATKRMDDSWKNIMLQIQSIWDEAAFDDEELGRARGNLPKMVNLIADKTGESRDQILRKMGSML